jgi:hypothetical protein
MHVRKSQPPVDPSERLKAVSHKKEVPFGYVPPPKEPKLPKEPRPPTKRKRAPRKKKDPSDINEGQPTTSQTQPYSGPWPQPDPHSNQQYGVPHPIASNSFPGGPPSAAGVQVLPAELYNSQVDGPSRQWLRELMMYAGAAPTSNVIGG